ncbi:MAG: transporter, ATP-binding protein [Enterovirga sp.]|nr:transporter, ATP-binding protein [Enterovirga sp.]
MTHATGDRAALAFEDLSLGYDRHPAVHHLSGRIECGDLVALVGPNGAGKSTLLKGIMGEIGTLGGRVDRGGLRPRDIAYLPQAAEIDRSFPIGVFDLAALGLWRRTGAWRRVGRNETALIDAALAAVGLTGFEARPLGTLSGGQMQRALFARVLLQDARLVLLDEPFTAVDAATTADLVALIRRWHDEGRTVVAALHDFDQVRRHFPRTLLLAREAIALGPTDAVLSAANLARARQLWEAWDEAAETCRRDPHEHRHQAHHDHDHRERAA